MAYNNYLKLENIVKKFPGVLALDKVSFELQIGEVHALVGENGAGKSTLIKILSGAHTPDEGTITIGDSVCNTLTPWESKELGIEVVYQEFNLMPALSVAENIYLTEIRGNRFLVNMKEFERKAQELFDTLGINYVNPKSLVKDLTPASMQLVEIAKAISKPTTKILVMDEPTAPLTNMEVDILLDIIKQLKEKGIAIIYISHRLDEIFQISDRVTVLRDGCNIKTMITSETNRSELVELMVGRKLNENFPPRISPVGEECVLSVENITGGRVKNVSFKLNKGEILGIGGLVGVGRTEMVRMLFGADKKDSGRIYLNGKEITIRHPEHALKHGITLVPEDRQQHGVQLAFSIMENISISILKKISKFSVVNRLKERKITEEMKQVLDIKAHSIMVKVDTLSGGNQQKVSLGKCLAIESKILILDEPTRGIDVGAKMEIYNLMRRLCSEGMSIIMISSEMDELLGMSDRIVVLCNGQVADILNRTEATQERVLELAAGLE